MVGRLWQPASENDRRPILGEEDFKPAGIQQTDVFSDAQEPLCSGSRSVRARTSGQRRAMPSAQWTASAALCMRTPASTQITVAAKRRAR